MKESDLYPPLKRFLESQSYEVKGEVHDCDVLAVRGDEAPVVVELKLNLNLNVVLQAVDRLSLTPKVYIGVPRQCAVLKKRGKQITKLLRMLGLGLIAIHVNRGAGSALVLLDPGDYQPRKSKHRQERLLGEFHRRVGDPNLGGTSKRLGVMTVYRQRALEIAQHLEEHGPTKASVVAEAVQDAHARTLLYGNVYGWFERVSQGIYSLSPRGEEELPLWKAQAD
ncbi:MAG: hypothetical protein HC809_00435 [Gammaproteobacteria bacterium]|nr:hypothetical protein [Gammaproteobacteria bacterium]